MNFALDTFPNEWFFFQLRKAQEDVGELQTVNEHLQKRFDKLKNKRKDET